MVYLKYVFFYSNGGTYNDQVRERSLESAVTEFQRRFHISVDDIEANRRESNSTIHQVREVKDVCMFVNIKKSEMHI
jgi:hypothetical protein